MSNALNINATKRDLLGSANARRFRHQGLIPINVYSKGEDSLSLLISEADAKIAQKHNGMLTITCTTCGTTKSAVIKEVQMHPISNKILHIDFHAVKADEVIRSVVPIVLEGEPAGLRQGGQLEQVLRELEVESLPANIPEVITIDVSGIELGQALHVKDVKMPEGVTCASDGDLIVAHVRAPKMTSEENAAEGAAEAAPAEEKK